MPRISTSLAPKTAPPLLGAANDCDEERPQSAEDRPGPSLDPLSMGPVPRTSALWMCPALGAALLLGVIVTLLAMTTGPFQPAGGAQPESDLDARRLLGLGVLGAALAFLTCSMAYAMWALKRDAQHRRHIEEANHRARRVLQAVFDSAPTAICAKDRHGRVLLANRRFAEMYGLRAGTLAGKTLHELAPKLLADRLREIDRRVLESGAGLEVEEPLPVGGAIRVFLIAATPILDTAGATSGVCCGTIELTQRKALEQQLRRAQKMDLVGQIAGGVAHDFNNLLTAILGSSAFLKDGLPFHSQLVAEVEQIDRACERARNLTRQLLAFARRQVIEPVSLDLGERLRDLHPMLRRMIGETIDLVTVPAEGTWPVLIDPGQLEQVVANLAVNARDAMPNGGTLTIATENLRIERSDPTIGLPPGDYALLMVRDTGTGVSLEARAHLFEPFFTTKERGKGTGLGLATCYGIAHQAGGTILVKDAPGGGASFEVLLPRTSTPAEPKDMSLDETPLPRGTERVLLVEDEPMVRATTRHTLESLGYEVLAASHGEEALLLARRTGTPFDLLVTDIVMPQMGGRTLAEQLHATSPALPVLYMSGYVDDAAVLPELGHVETTFLQKPFTPRALAVKVREALASAPR